MSGIGAVHIGQNFCYGCEGFHRYRRIDFKQREYIDQLGIFTYLNAFRKCYLKNLFSQMPLSIGQHARHIAGGGA